MPGPDKEPANSESQHGALSASAPPQSKTSRAQHQPHIPLRHALVCLVLVTQLSPAGTDPYGTHLHTLSTALRCRAVKTLSSYFSLGDFPSPSKQGDLATVVGFSSPLSWGRLPATRPPCQSPSRLRAMISAELLNSPIFGAAD